MEGFFMEERRDKNGVFMNERRGKNDGKWASQEALFLQTIYFLGLWGKQQWILTQGLVIFIRL